jgi:hypothetical protein
MNQQVYSLSELSSLFKETILQTPLFTKIIFFLSAIIMIFNHFYDMTNCLVNSSYLSLFNF